MGVELSATSSGPDAGRDAGDRLASLWHLLVGATLAVPTTITLLHRERDGAVVLALAAGFVLWHWFLLVRDRSWLERTVPAVVYWVGAATFLTLLVGLGDTYSIMLYGLYPLGFVTLGWWGLVPVAGLTALVGWRLGADGPGTWTNLLATTALAFVIAVVVHATARQSEQRRAALEELAAARAELAATARRAGVLEERQRLARELHDTVAQGLTSVVTHLEAAEQAVAQQPVLARSHLDTARHAAREGLGELRRSVHALRPARRRAAARRPARGRRPLVRRAGCARAGPGDRRPGAAAAGHGGGAAAHRAGGPGEHRAARPGAPRRRLAVLPRRQRHPRRGRRRGRLHRHARPRPDGGFGLVGMRERIAAVGGRLDVESAPGEGTTVAAEVPS